MEHKNSKIQLLIHNIITTVIIDKALVRLQTVDILLNNINPRPLLNINNETFEHVEIKVDQITFNSVKDVQVAIYEKRLNIYSLLLHKRFKVKHLSVCIYYNNRLVHLPEDVENSLYDFLCIDYRKTNCYNFVRTVVLDNWKIRFKAYDKPFLVESDTFILGDVILLADNNLKIIHYGFCLSHEMVMSKCGAFPLCVCSLEELRKIYAETDHVFIIKQEVVSHSLLQSLDEAPFRRVRSSDLINTPPELCIPEILKSITRN